jgi:hypothetical protein
MSLTCSHRVRALVVAGVLALSLSGCSPSDLGVTGITVDENGAAVIVLAVCRDHIDVGGILDTGTDGKAYRSAGSWTSAQRIGPGLTLLPVAAPPSGWVQERPSRPLLPQVKYEAWGGTADHNGATSGARFTVEDLKGLSPGTVRYQQFREGKDGGGVATDQLIAVAEFQKAACG